GFIVTNVSPYTTEGIVDTPIVLLLLAGIWFGVTSLIALILYPIHSYFSPFIDKRFLTRKGLKQGVWISSALTIIVLLSLTNTFNVFTGGFTLALLIVLEIWFT
ncbi:hypothetical protein GW793_00975, partial [bacterium]